MSDVFHTIVSKRDTRAFSDRQIEPELLDRLVQAARMAGSAKAAQPVRLIVVTDQAQKDRLAVARRKLREAIPSKFAKPP